MNTVGILIFYAVLLEAAKPDLFLQNAVGSVFCKVKRCLNIRISGWMMYKTA